MLMYLICVAYSSAFGNNDSLHYAVSLHQAAKFAKALPVFVQLAKEFEKRNDRYSYALCRLKIADIIRNYGGVQTSIEILNTNEQFLNAKFEKPNQLFAENHLAKAQALYTLSRLNEFKSELLKSIVVKKNLGLPETELTEDYFQLSRYYLEFQNQRDSCYYWAVKALKIAKSNRQKSTFMLPRIYNLLGYHFHPASIAYFLNDFELFKDRLTISRKYYDSALHILARQKLTDELTRSKIYHNLGNSYSNEGLLTTALTYYHKSLKVYEAMGSPTELALKDWVIARAYERLGLFDSAIYQLHTGVSRLVPEFKTGDGSALPDLRPTLDNIRLLTLISLKGNQYLHRYKQSKQLNDLRTAYNHFLFLLKFNQYVINQSTDEQSLTYINYIYGSNAYQQLISTAHQIFILTHDKSFVTNTYSLISSAKYAWLSRKYIEPSLNQAVQAVVLQQEFNVIMHNISKQCKGIIPEEVAELLPKPMRENDLKDDNSRAFEYTDGMAFINQLQLKLKAEDEILIDYYRIGQELHAVIVSPVDFSIEKMVLPKDFDIQVRNLKKNMLANSPYEYARKANALYKIVLDSVLSENVHAGKLIISPDGNLQEIPWDALVRDTMHTEIFGGLDYLVNHYVIRTVLTPHQLLSKNIESNGFYGVSADFNHSKRFTNIPFSADIVRKKAKEMNGMLNSVLQKESDAISILHITAHVHNDSLRPYQSTMFFSDRDSITVGELARYKFPASLVILNSCQTGRGTYYQSEGTIGFSRSFYAAGAQSVLMTLWNVDDKATADVLGNFYSMLEKGNRLDAALNEAKRDYIKNTSTDEMANPYYWAGLQLSGKSDPVVSYSYSRIIVCSLIVIFSFAGIGYALKRRSSSVKSV